MDENVQHEITLACIALLHKNAVAYQQANASSSTGGYCCPVPSRKGSVLPEPKTKKEAIAWLLKVASEPDTTFDQVIDALWIVYKRSRPSSQTRQWVVHLLLDLARREESAANDAIRAAGPLCTFDLQGSQEQQEAVRILLALAKRRDIFFGDTVEAAHTLYIQSPKGSQARELGVEMLLAQAHWPDTTVAQAQEAAQALAFARGPGMLSKDWNRAIQALIELAQRPDLSFEDAVVLDDQRSSVDSTKALVKQQLAAKKQMWEAVAQRPDLTLAQRPEVAQAIKDYTEALHPSGKEMPDQFSPQG
jgi:hypothetical protein